MSNELAVVDEESTTPMIQQFDIVDVDAAAAFMDNYQELVKALLDEDNDYQGGKKKKSAWRKLETAFNISDEVVEKDIIREDNYQIISAFFMVKCTLPNGRSCIGVGSASIFDKIRYNATKNNPADTETPSNFELRGRFTNAEHDVIATAHTRAKSRAIADLIGAGETPAEDLPKKVSRKSSNDEKEPANEPKKSNGNGKARRTRRSKKPVVEAEVIEAEVVEDEPSTPNNFKDIDNDAVKKAINRLEESDEEVSKGNLMDELFSLYDLGNIDEDEYFAAKAKLGMT